MVKKVELGDGRLAIFKPVKIIDIVNTSLFSFDENNIIENKISITKLSSLKDIEPLYSLTVGNSKCMDLEGASSEEEIEAYREREGMGEGSIKYINLLEVPLPILFCYNVDGNIILAIRVSPISNIFAIYGGKDIRFVNIDQETIRTTISSQFVDIVHHLEKIDVLLSSMVIKMSNLRDKDIPKNQLGAYRDMVSYYIKYDFPLYVNGRIYNFSHYEEEEYTKEKDMSLISRLKMIKLKLLAKF